MASPDKIESVKKVTETLDKNPASDMEQMAQNKDQFDSLMSSSQAAKPTSFERIETKSFTVENTNATETKPIFAEENFSSQKSGTATDQQKKGRGGGPSDDEVDGVSGTKKKEGSTSASLMDEVSKLHKNVSGMSKLSPDKLKAQAKQISSQIEQVKTQLSQSQTQIKPSYQTLMRNRLTHIDENLKIALSKAGVEYTPPPSLGAKTGENPVQKFIGFLTNSQHQLENLQQTVEGFSESGKQLTPANMLAIQMKMGQIQQQIELFTSLLNKALESTKTIMNVQV